MKRKTFKILLPLLTLAILLIMLNVNVYTRRGVNYQWSSVKIPLYLKVLDFFDRHYNYKALAGRITAGAGDKEGAVMKIFRWTFDNIKENPESLPIVDDHTWHIIIRGYGVEDQYCDVFTTLCNYAGFRSFYLLLNDRDSGHRIPLSLVEIKGEAYIFDPYRGVYFEGEGGKLAGIKLLRSGGGREMRISEKRAGVNYSQFFAALSAARFTELRRANIQSPLKRLIYQFRRLMRH